MGLGRWLLGSSCCTHGWGKEKEGRLATHAQLLGKDSVSTSEQEGSLEPFHSTLLVQIGKLRPSEQEYVFE